MSRGGFYRGTNIEQDARFKNKEKLILDNKKFPKEFDFKVDIGKVKDYLIQVELKVIRQWVEKRINEILGFEDEFLNNYIITLLEDKTEQLDPKKIQHLLTGRYFIIFYLLIYRIFKSRRCYFYERPVESSDICSNFSKWYSCRNSPRKRG